MSVAEANGYTSRVIICDGVRAPFQALVMPDTDYSSHFRAWIVAWDVFVIVNGQLVEVTDVH